MTSEERLLWHGLRRNQLGGLHFRRQQVIGEFVLDFYCHRARLAVEVDGGAHDTQGGRDERRDATLRRLGIEVVRVPCDAVRREPDLVLGMIREEAEKRVRVRVRRT
jgi:very-short-patch-repair endonuclease